MATDFPTSKQTFTNPTSANNLDSPSHAGQHADINDTVEAIQDKLGTAAQDNAPAANKFLRGTGANTSEWDIDFVDEDDMFSDSATAVPSQQSVKAYADDNFTPNDGWIPSGEAWTYASAMTFTVSGDQTSKYTKGTKIKLTNSTTKYFYVVSSSYSDPNTTVIVTGETDLADAAITAPYYSYADCPQGFKRGEDWYRAEASKQTQSINTASQTQVKLVETQDPNGNFASYQYVTPIAGIYQISAYDRWDSAVANTRYSHLINGIGASWREGYPSAIGKYSGFSSNTVYLAKGVTISMDVYQTSGGARNLEVGKLQIQFIGI